MCFFFLFLVVLNSVFTITVEIENSRLKLALAILTGAPIKAANDVIEMIPLVADKTINDLSKPSKKRNIFTKPFTH